jgi:hypothetical protein
MDGNQQKTKKDNLWEELKKVGRVKNITEEEVFHLTKEEFEKCRFKIVNQNYRLAECVVHTNKFSHGFRLHPPHMWDIRDGIIYKRVGKKFVKFVPSFKENVNT